MKKFLSKMKELLDTQDLNLECMLDKYEEWDSLSQIALISFAQKYYHINITLDDLSTCKNINDIYQLFTKTNGGGGIARTLYFVRTHLFKSTRNFHPTTSLEVA